jgi:hypothetical protein
MKLSRLSNPGFRKSKYSKKREPGIFTGRRAQACWELREIFSNYLTLNNNGTLSGYVVDRSEQFVIGASKKILSQESNPSQHPDKGLNPVLLVKVDPDIDSLDELMKIRDDIFPEEPEFYKKKKQK